MSRLIVGDRFRVRGEPKEFGIRGKLGTVIRAPTSGIRPGDAFRADFLVYEIRLDDEIQSRHIEEVYLEIDNPSVSPASFAPTEHAPRRPLRVWFRRLLVALHISPNDP